MLSRILTLLITAGLAMTAEAQVKPATPVPPTGAAPAAPQYSFKRTGSGIMYTFAIDKPGSSKPKEGDVIKLHMRSIASGRLLYDSWSQFKGKPAEFGMNKPSFAGDIAEVIAFMSVGDSLIALVDADLIYKNTKNKKPDFIKKGDKIEYQLRLVSIKTKEQAQKEQQAQMQKQIQEQLAKQKRDMEKQALKDEKSLQDYFKKKGLTPLKSSGGLYYTVNSEGEGQKPPAGAQAKMNYTGRLLDGTAFDSNVDTAFGHTQPFEFKLGASQVIKGWDEGVALLRKGSKATFYIPSALGYGASSIPGGKANPKGIPAYSCLVFDVELLDFSLPVDEDSELQKYFSSKGITPTKTASGLYYQLTERGTGAPIQAGQKAVMNYTGQLLDGTKFDSNVDSAFNHVQPFEFMLGKGQVIKGWDEGIALLTKGSKATLFIPSNLAYGSQSMPGSGANPKGIPANSTLIFDVELVDIKDGN